MAARARPGGIALPHPVAFWLGTAAVTAGVVLHLPMFFGAEDMDYALAGMGIDGWMIAGMVLIVVGLAATVYGVLQARRPPEATMRLRVKALDDAPLSKAHVALLVVMAAAVTIDITKPTTLGFVVPGFAKEYDLKSALNPNAETPAALLPLAGITGTVIGSLMWGWMGDRIGRRASILIAGIIFIATSICGSMPDYRLNLLMCFIMGLAVGGMLPIAFALLAETIPARHRSWLMVLIGGDIAGAYLITSNLADWLEPTYGWRILWLVGLPSGVLLILLNRWIPESPRFLLANGRRNEARAVMECFHAEIVDEPGETELAVEHGLRARFDQLLRRPFGGITLAMAIYGLAYGLVTFGFVLWLPTNLRELGLGVGASDRLLADSALIAFPAIVLVALAYGFWSSKKTMIAVAAITAATLSAFVVLGDSVVDNQSLLQVLLVLLIMSSSAVVAVLTPYSSEVYPTRIRSRGTGLAAGASKAGGVLGIGIVVVAVSPPSIAMAALIAAIPLAVAVLAVAWFGPETRKRRLEEITAEELAPAADRA
jgi:putative MFS transporter